MERYEISMQTTEQNKLIIDSSQGSIQESLSVSNTQKRDYTEIIEK